LTPPVPKLGAVLTATLVARAWTGPCDLRVAVALVLAIELGMTTRAVGIYAGALKRAGLFFAHLGLEAFFFEQMRAKCAKCGKIVFLRKIKYFAFF